MNKVLKFGGTSVGSADNIRKVVDIVLAENAQIVVLSAMSGTTDMLIKLSALIKDGRKEEAAEVLLNIKTKYNTCINELFTESSWLQIKESTFEYLTKRYEFFQLEIDKGVDNSFEIIAQGELMTTFIFNQYLNSFLQENRGYKRSRSKLLNATELVIATSDYPTTSINKDYLSKTLLSRIKQEETSNGIETIFVIQGFISLSNKGTVSNLGRGGSDYSAALFGAAINSKEVQIWTDIDGIHNNDPRFVANTFPISYMHYDEAAELAYFGAKILHPETIRPSKEAGIPVRIKNTNAPEKDGTLIESSDIKHNTPYRAIAAKDNITMIRIISSKMVEAYGFLREIFEVFHIAKTSVDMITTTEVSVAITLDDTSRLKEVLNGFERLKQEGKIEQIITEEAGAIICVVGDFSPYNNVINSKIFQSFEHIPIKMISYGGSYRSISFLIDSKSKIEALNSLNKNLF